ncbi:RDD family protein [Streptomyces sp. URMC 123]|uniref:RDD family protein n=1 Tax=Streptomyces sp. URMC 123 TaxID=3423403 RepID=UPI003F1D11DA
MSDLVTGEAVVLDLRPARLPSRALAVFIDLVVVWTVYTGVSTAVLLATSSLDEAVSAALSVAMFVLVLVGGPIAVETLSHGQSLGKLACGLRVVREDGGPIRFRHALVRGAMGVVEILMTFGVVACVASLVSARGRRLGDVFAGTLVVRERIPVARSAAVPPAPPWLVERFAGLDLSAVPEGLWLAVRQYLSRTGQLDPQVSESMAQRLAWDVAGRTGAPVPDGVPPAVYLAAVVAERQARDARRAFGPTAAPPSDGRYPAPYPAAAHPYPAPDQSAPHQGFGLGHAAGAPPVPGGAPGPHAATAAGAAPAADGPPTRTTGFQPPV